MERKSNADVPLIQWLVYLHPRTIACKETDHTLSTSRNLQSMDVIKRLKL